MCFTDSRPIGEGCDSGEPTALRTWLSHSVINWQRWPILLRPFTCILGCIGCSYIYETDLSFFSARIAAFLWVKVILSSESSLSMISTAAFWLLLPSLDLAWAVSCWVFSDTAFCSCLLCFPLSSFSLSLLFCCSLLPFSWPVLLPVFLSEPELYTLPSAFVPFLFLLW